MSLTPAQLATLKNDLTVTRAATAFQGSTLGELWTGGADGVLAQFYAQVASPQVLLWKPSVPSDALVNAVLMSEFLALTVAKQNGWFMMTQPSMIDTTLARVRQNFIDIFGGASVTVANLVVTAQRPATYGEALFSASGGSPGSGFVSAVFGAGVSAQDITAARDV